LVLIDDGSTDGTEQMVRERIENLTVIRGNGDWWWAGSLQQGFNFLKKEGLSHDDYVLIINDDVVFGRDFIAKGISILDKNKQTLLLVPSRLEAFGQTASEAHACGIPVVTFDASGTADIVDHLKTGYLATAYDVEDFCAGILWILENDQRRKQLGHDTRRKAENCFDHLLVAKEHIKTYKKVLNA
jgi:glycosyltransferase involved in cell wall biosynthesis